MLGQAFQAFNTEPEMPCRALNKPQDQADGEKIRDQKHEILIYYIA